MHLIRTIQVVGHQRKACQFQSLHRPHGPPSFLDEIPVVGPFAVQSHQLFFWLVVGPPLWKIMKVNWDDDIPNIWENKKWQPNHQPELFFGVKVASFLHHPPLVFSHGELLTPHPLGKTRNIFIFPSDIDPAVTGGARKTLSSTSKLIVMRVGQCVTWRYWKNYLGDGHFMIYPPLKKWSTPNKKFLLVKVPIFMPENPGSLSPVFWQKRSCTLWWFDIAREITIWTRKIIKLNGPSIP